MSEIDTDEESAAYDAWLRAKVAASLADPCPPIPHDEAMAEVQKNMPGSRAETGLVPVGAVWDSE